MRKYNSSNIKFETSMKRSDLCDYSDPYILVSRIMTITGNYNAKKKKKKQMKEIKE